MLAGAVTVTSIAGYVALSFTINGLPTYPPAGWVAVLQPATATDTDVVQLLVQARTEAGQTRAAYDLVVSGPRPYTGDLLIGGSARLATAVPDPVMPASSAPLRIQRIPDLIFNYGAVINLGAVQLVHISLPVVSPCPAQPGGLPPGTLPGVSAEGIVGVAYGPVQQNWAGPAGWWHGPHISQAWPLTGAFPGVPADALGDFTAISGLSGSWARPVQEYTQVGADDIPVTWSTDSTTPAASGPYPLTWQSRTPVSPLAQLTDSPSLALLQDWLVISAVGLGIAGSMLASLLFEWLRPRLQHAPAASNSPPPRVPAPADRPMRFSRDSLRRPSHRLACSRLQRFWGGSSAGRRGTAGGIASEVARLGSGRLSALVSKAEGSCMNATSVGWRQDVPVAVRRSSKLIRR